MDKKEALGWIEGKRSSANYMPQDQVAKTDAFMVQQAYWVLKANADDLVNKEDERKYCWKCGAELVEKVYDTFNEQTGEQNKGMICKKCTCDHDWLILPFWHINDYQCRKCGEKQMSVY